MDQKELLEVIGAMRETILQTLLTANLSKDKDAKRALKSIDNMFDRLGVDVEEVLPKEVLVNYYEGVDIATKQLDNAGVEPVHGLSASISSSGTVASAFKTQVHIAAISKITDDTMLDFKAAIRTAKKNSNKAISTALDSVKKDLQSGQIKGKARKAISQKVAESFAKNGMTSFITADGKELPLDFYAETVTRTNLKKAATKGAASRYEENGVELFTISGNDPTCHECAALRGYVFTSNPDDKEFTYMDPENIHPHPNCQCSIRPYVREYRSEAEIEQAKRKSKQFDPNKDNRSAREKKEYADSQRIKANRNYEKKRYADIKGLLGDDAPKTLGGFRRMKKADSENYHKLLQDYQEALKSIK